MVRETESGNEASDLSSERGAARIRPRAPKEEAGASAMTSIPRTPASSKWSYCLDETSTTRRSNRSLAAKQKNRPIPKTKALSPTQGKGAEGTNPRAQPEYQVHNQAPPLPRRRYKSRGAPVRFSTADAPPMTRLLVGSCWLYFLFRPYRRRTASCKGPTRSKTRLLVIACLAVAVAGAVPKWTPTWDMAKSTIIMP
jgi:hypothetical protein